MTKKKKNSLKNHYTIIEISFCDKTTVLGFNSFIANNLDNFSKNSSYEPKRCLIIFYFTTHALSYEILYL